MKRIFCLVLVAVFFLGFSGPPGVHAQRRKISIKLASMVPENTPWGAKLNQMSREWAQITGGEVELVVYHNSVAGGEDDVVRKLRLNQIQGAVLTSFGLNAISPEILTLSCPFLIRNEGELDAVLENLKPELERRIDEKGFFTLAWSKAGWAKVFAKTPVTFPADLKRMKIATNPNEPEMEQALKTIGYPVVPVNSSETIVALNSGRIDAVYQSPVLVASMQVFGITKYMTSINIAPVMGGIVLNRTAWRAIPDRYKSRIIESAKNIEREMDGEIQRLEREAISTMIRYGLRIQQLTPEQDQVWYDDVERSYPAMLGTTLDRDIFGRIDTILKNYRSRR
ncbi:MAG: TRAP transporter substrate-binding protein DctP [Treponema sp.]|jgi:TRAP-type C4-dicarboxylate transport system substrate-binding protein|nr:TRAP transporter substrate-binding protein DctP [Treponema sp.]